MGLVSRLSFTGSIPFLSFFFLRRAHCFDGGGVRTATLERCRFFLFFFFLAPPDIYRRLLTAFSIGIVPAPVPTNNFLRFPFGWRFSGRWRSSTWWTSFLAPRKTSADGA